MEICFEKDGLDTYMVVPYKENWEDSYENKLFEFHKVPYFLQYEYRKCNEEEALYYKLKYRTTIKSVVKHLSFSIERVVNFIESIIGVIENTEEYLLDYDKIIWKSDCIFIEVDTGKLEFCYSPIEVEGGLLKDFLLEIIQGIDKKQEEVLLLLLNFYNVVTEPDCNLEKIMAFRENAIGKRLAKDDVVREHKILNQGKIENSLELKEIKKTDDKKMVEKIVRVFLFLVAGIDLILIVCLFFNILTYENILYLFIGLALLIILVIVYMYITKEESADDIMEEYFQTEGKEISVEKMEEEKTLREKEKGDADIVRRDEILGETTILSEDDLDNRKKEIIREEDSKQLYLEPIKKEKYSPIHPKEKSIVLGSMKENVDYYLTSRGISRMHAKIIKKSEGLYLFDLNSTNGTFLNGDMIKSGEEYELEVGDLVGFADVEFYVLEEQGNINGEKLNKEM